MCSRPQPCMFISFLHKPRAADLKRALKDFSVVAEVDLGKDHPPVPVRCNGQTRWTTGACRTVLADDELELALSACCCENVRMASIYRREELFRSFVRFFYRAKLDGTASGRHADVAWAKLCLNSLYGKFAQRSKRWTDDAGVMAQDWYAYW